MSRPPLDRDRIGVAALALADAHGLDAVTARNLAAELGVTPMALYRHVPNVGAIVDGLLDRVFTEARIVDHATPRLEAFLLETFERIHDCLVAHPAVLPLLGTPAGYGPAALRVVDTTLARLMAAGHPAGTATGIFHALLSYTIGAASLRAAMRSRPGTPPAGAFDGSPFVRSSIGALGKLGGSAMFRQNLGRVLEASLRPPSEVSATSRRRPTSRRAT